VGRIKGAAEQTDALARGKCRQEGRQERGHRWRSMPSRESALIATYPIPDRLDGSRPPSLTLPRKVLSHSHIFEQPHQFLLPRHAGESRHPALGGSAAEKLPAGFRLAPE
jgi:hypothetical protein